MTELPQLSNQNRKHTDIFWRTSQRTRCCCDNDMPVHCVGGQNNTVLLCCTVEPEPSRSVLWLRLHVAHCGINNPVGDPNTTLTVTKPVEKLPQLHYYLRYEISGNTRRLRCGQLLYDAVQFGTQVPSFRGAY